MPTAHEIEDYLSLHSLEDTERGYALGYAESDKGCLCDRCREYLAISRAEWRRRNEEAIESLRDAHAEGECGIF